MASASQKLYFICQRNSECPSVIFPVCDLKFVHQITSEYYDVLITNHHRKSLFTWEDQWGYLEMNVVQRAACS